MNPESTNDSLNEIPKHVPVRLGGEVGVTVSEPSLRDMFASAALGALINSPRCPPTARELAADCYRIADAMMDVRTPPEPDAVVGP